MPANCSRGRYKLCSVFHHDAFAAHPDPRLVERRRIVGDGHDTDAIEPLALEQILKPLPPITPRLANDITAAESQHVEEHERHVPTDPVPLLEHRLNPLVAVARDRLTIEHGGRERPAHLS